MTLWLVLAFMIAAAMVLVATPFLGKCDKKRAAFSSEVQVFRDQLMEVEREAADGLIDADQIDTARLEIKRRLLGIERANKIPVVRLSPAERKCAAMAVAGLIALGGVSIYAVKGSPYLLSSPSIRADAFSAHDAERQSAVVSHLLLDMKRQSRAAAELDTVRVMISRLVERLRQNPNNAEDWQTLGWSYTRVKHFSEAAAAYAKAIELKAQSRFSKDGSG